MKKIITLSLLSALSVNAFAEKNFDFDASVSVNETQKVTRSATKAAPNSSKTNSHPYQNKAKTPSEALKLIADTDTKYGNVKTYLETTSLNPIKLTVEGSEGVFLSGFLNTEFEDGVAIGKETAYSTTEQIYVACHDSYLYQNRLAAFNKDGSGIFARSYDKTSFEMGDWTKAEPNTINKAKVDGMCNYVKSMSK